MKVFKDSEYAELPSFATAGSACFDIKACLEPDSKIKGYGPHNRVIELPVKRAGDGRIFTSVQPQYRTLIPTGLIFDIPSNQVLKFFIRSGIAIKTGLFMANSTAIIDEDYVDPAFIMIYNAGDTPIMIYHGDRIAQGRLEKNIKTVLEETFEKPERKTERDGGLGSTGV